MAIDLFRRKQLLQSTAWMLIVLVVTLAVAAWSQVRLDGRITGYDIFPLLGLLAFSMMWTHYIAGALRTLMGVERSALSLYFKVTSGVVLVLLLLHSGISSYLLWSDGAGLPPFSYLQAYGQPLAIFAGLTALVAFLLFELYRWFQGASWWKYIDWLNVGAMYLILYHGYSLGGEFALEWFRGVWITYGILLTVAVIIKIRATRRSHEKKSTI